MISSYYLCNNVSLVIGVIQTILKSGRSFSMAELSLLLPFLLDEKIVSVMLNPNEEYTLGSLITKNNIALANFNDRYLSLLPLTYQSLSFLLDINAITISDGVVIACHTETIGDMVTESGSTQLSNICKVSQRLFAMLERENIYEIYKRLKIEL